MIVIADSGPIIHLSMVGQLELLPRFYGEICIPRIVYREVVEDGAGLPGSAELRAAASSSNGSCRRRWMPERPPR